MLSPSIIADLPGGVILRLLLRLQLFPISIAFPILFHYGGFFFGGSFLAPEYRDPHRHDTHVFPDCVGRCERFVDRVS